MIHLIRMSIRTGQNEQDQTQQEQTENTQDVNNLGAGTITVYAQNKDVSGFDKKEVSLEAITPETVLSQLAAAGVLPSDTTVLSFTKKERMENKSLIWIFPKSLELT